MTISFQNPGLIDLTAVTVLGINAKGNDNPIGFFGTGLKYAIASILRVGGNIELYRGLDHFVFTARPKIIRDKPFHIIWMNDKELGFTTDLGKQWEPWTVYRELYCNTIDEDGQVFSGTGTPQANTTLFIIDCPQVEEIEKTKDLYFLKPALLVANKSVELHDRSLPAIFGKGIRIDTTNQAYLFVPNYLDAELTEDRTLANAWDFSYQYAQLIYQLTDKNLLTKILSAPNGFREAAIDLNWAIPHSPEFLEVARKLYSQGLLTNDTVSSFVRRQLLNDEPEEYQSRSHEQQAILKAIIIAEALGFMVSNYEIKVVKTLGKGVLGQAKNNKIYISQHGLEHGDNSLACTLIEEYIHLEYGYYDASREMQDFLLRRMISFGRSLNEI